MKYYLILLLALMSSMTYAQQGEKQPFLLKGQIENAPKAMLYLSEKKPLSEKAYKDSTLTDEAGNYTFQGVIPEPRLFTLRIKGRNKLTEIANFYVENSSVMTLNGLADSLYKAKVTGSKEQEIFEAFVPVYNKAISDASAVLYKPYLESKARNDSAAMLKEGGIADRKMIDKVAELASDFVVQQPGSAFSLELVDMLMKYARLSTADSLMRLIERTPAGKYEAGLKLRKNLKTLMSLRIGSMAPDFTQPDTAGTQVSLSSLRGKYVFVDFWASWCAPCRAENPNVLKAYNKYKDQNFTVLAVSLDENRKSWLKAIKDDNLPWTQLSDLKGFASEAGKLYAVTSIPASYLIDPEGKIIAVNLRGEALELALEQNLNKGSK